MDHCLAHSFYFEACYNCRRARERHLATTSGTVPDVLSRSDDSTSLITTEIIDNTISSDNSFSVDIPSSDNSSTSDSSSSFDSGFGGDSGGGGASGDF